MGKVTLNQKRKMLIKLQKIGINTEKEILNLKVQKLKELKNTEKITMNEIEVIWLLQEDLEHKDILKILTEE